MSTGIVTIAGGATWQEVAADRQRHRDATIAQLEPPLPELPAGEIPLNTTTVPKEVLSEEELTITETTLDDLIEKLASGQWTSTAVIKAFMRRAGLAQKLSNCVTELLPERALKRAADLDAYFATNKKPMGPLHGVPISVKEHVGMAGCDLNVGFVGWVGNVVEEDAHILKCLRDAGAVFYVRTTQPQTLMQVETSSNLYGTTVNPYNTTLTAGGSSGGEGALLGLRGSLLSIGTDIGGSIRSPAANNGVFGYKPTSLRLPLAGCRATMAGSDHILPAIGPLSTSLAGLKTFTKAVLDREPWLREPSLVPIPWRETGDVHKGGRRVRIGVMADDGVVMPHPPIKRAMAELVAKLRKSPDVEVVEWKPWDHDRAWSIIASLYFCDGGADVISAVESSGEPWRPLSRWILRENPHVREHTIGSLWAANRARDAYRAQYAQLWGGDGQPVDAILCPVGPGAAPKLETSRYWGYTAQWNLLDYPAIVFPTRDCVSPEKDGAGAGTGAGAGQGGDYAYPEGYVPRGESDRYNYELWRKHGAEGYRDAPISLQLVGRRYEDEKLFSALETVLDAAGLPHSF
ncbi:acetamidase [Biscogniauxia mediterranea]|nr:acetamidase [Biscogniauxia mediterranea]